MDDKLSLKGKWSGHVNYLYFGGHQPYLRNAKARMIKFCVHVGYVKSQDKDDKTALKEAWSGLRNPHYIIIQYIIWRPNDISGTIEARIVKFCVQVDCIKYLSTATNHP